MKIAFFFIVLFLVTTAFAEVKTEFSGNLEVQTRHSKNNREAKKSPLFQDWDEENFNLIYGNVNGKVEFATSRIEANWFGRYSQSDLYDPKPTILGPRDPYLATQIFTFPNKLVARDLFKLQHVDQSGDHQFESILNKLYYEWESDQNRFMAGRIYINYGLGEIFNPINPFNQPTGLTAISQVAQGNDGMSFTFFLSEIHTVQFLLLGDKSNDNYDGAIDKTVWAHGEFQYSNKLQLDYVIGEDQERHKVGGQASYQFDESLVFTQLLYQTQNVKNKPSNNLWDILIGYDEQMTSKWHLRFEGGYQKSNRFSNPRAFERFLPTEYFAALANVYEVHPLFKVNGTIINDIKSGFNYFIAKGTYSFIENMELEVFGFTPVSKGDEADNVAQKLVTTDIGLAIRGFF